MKSLNTKVLTTYALFLAIMLIMAFVPGLGFIPTSVAAIVIIQVPVIIASYFLGFKGGMFFGLVFGLTSVIKCFTEPDAFAMIIMNAGGLKTVGLMIICLIVPRIMIGVTSRAVYTLFNKFDKTRISSMAVAAFVGTITNTIDPLPRSLLSVCKRCMYGTVRSSNSGCSVQDDARCRDFERNHRGCSIRYNLHCCRSGIVQLYFQKTSGSG